MAHRKGRSALTGAGIALGVAILFGVLVANATTKAGLDRLLKDFTGNADVVVSPVGVVDATLPTGSVEQLRRLPGVRDVVAGYNFNTALPQQQIKNRLTLDTGREGVLLTGIFPDQEKKLQTYAFKTGHFPAPGADEAVVTNKLATELHLHMDQRLQIRGRARTEYLTIVGVLDDTGAARAGNGTRVFTSVATAQRLGGVGPDTFTDASIILRTHNDVDAWVNAHHDAVPGVRLQNAADLAAGFKQFLTTFGIFLTFFAGITLFVGAFLIYLTLSMAVIERTRMYGTLRALGATRTQVRRVVVREAIALCAVSIVAGLLLGLGLAVVLLKLIGSLFGIAIPSLVITPGAVVGAVVTGLAVTLISALVPARRAGRLAPVEAMKGDYARDTRLGRMWIVGAAILVVSTALNFALSGSQSGAGSLVVIFILLGAVLVVPMLLRPLALLLGRVTNRIARGVGEVAVLHLAKERSRSAYTLALVMVVMAMLFTTGGLYLSVRAAASQIVDRQFGADLFIQPRTPGHAGLERALAHRSDIAGVTGVGIGQTSAVDAGGSAEDFFVRIVDPATYFPISSFFWKDGDDASAQQALTRGHAVLISDEISTRLHIHRGQQIRLLTAEGRVGFDVAGVYIAPPGPPEISMGVRDGRAFLNSGEPFGYLANVRKGANAGAVASRITQAFPQQKLAVQTSADVKAQARNQIGTYFKIVYAILLIAAIVGLLGLANTLAMSVLQRFREIGILRAIGVTRSQTWRMVLVESSTMGLTAFVLSFPLAWLLTFMVVKATSTGFGFAMPTVYPWLWIPAVAGFGVLISVVAAIAPGRRAARLQVVTALQYE